MNLYISASNYYKANGLVAMLAKHFKGKRKLEIVSQWHQSAFPEGRLLDTEKPIRAENNLADLALADVIIMMDDYENVPGGKHFELGAAFMLKKKCIVLGRREHLYTRHRLVTNAVNLEELVGSLKEIQKSL